MRIHDTLILLRRDGLYIPVGIETPNATNDLFRLFQVATASTSRSGLKLRRDGVGEVAPGRRDGLYIPVGIETPQARLSLARIVGVATASTSRSGLKRYTRCSHNIPLCGRDGLYIPVGIETSSRREHPSPPGWSRRPLHPGRD